MGTEITIKTTDQKEATLMINATKMAGVLYELMSWRRAIYNGKNYDTRVLYKGELYTYGDWLKRHEELVKPEDKDENGIVKDGLLKFVYLEDDVEHRLGRELDEIRDLIYNYYE